MHRGATFTFDYVLYRDRFLHVTSSRIVVGGRFPFARADAIPLDNIRRVRVDPRPTRSFALGVGRRGRGRSPPGRLVLYVDADAARSIRLSAENAADAARAIRAGMPADATCNVEKEGSRLV